MASASSSTLPLGLPPRSNSSSNSSIRDVLLTWLEEGEGEGETPAPEAPGIPDGTKSSSTGEEEGRGPGIPATTRTARTVEEWVEGEWMGRHFNAKAHPALRYSAAQMRQAIAVLEEGDRAPPPR